LRLSVFSQLQSCTMPAIASFHALLNPKNLTKAQCLTELQTMVDEYNLLAQDFEHAQNQKKLEDRESLPTTCYLRDTLKELAKVSPTPNPNHFIQTRVKVTACTQLLAIVYMDKMLGLRVKFLPATQWEDSALLAIDTLWQMSPAGTNHELIAKLPNKPMPWDEVSFLKIVKNYYDHVAQSIWSVVEHVEFKHKFGVI